MADRDAAVETPGRGEGAAGDRTQEGSHPGPVRPRTKGIKAKGTSAETAVVRLAHISGWPHAERRALNGSTDRGDIAGIPSVVVEVKSGTRICLPEWLRETEVERVNDNATYGVLVVKPKGVGDTRVGEWPAVLPLSALLRLLQEAGYGSGEVADA